MRSYVVKRFSHFRHSRRRRMESASLLSRESTTLSFSKPQKGHFMKIGWDQNYCSRQDRAARSYVAAVQRNDRADCEGRVKRIESIRTEPHAGSPPIHRK